MNPTDFHQRRLDRFLEIGAISWFLFFLQYLYLGRMRTAVLDLVLTLLILRLRLSPRVARRADKLLFYCGSGLTVAALVSGQSGSLAIWYIAALPLAAGFLSGVREACKWAVISALLIVFVDLSEHFIRIPPEFVPDGWELTMGRLVLLAILLGGTLAFRVNADSHLKALDRQRRDLEKARRSAEEANESRARFLAVASHEFQTPLNAILGFSQLLLEERTESLTDTEARYCRNLHSAATKLHHLIQASLDYTLIADEPLEKFDMKIWPMFRQLAEEFSQDAADRGIEVCWEVEPDELTVKADRGILVQLLRQLVSNAVKFSPPKHPVRVTARRESDRVVFQVWDKGPGIEPRVQETIFEPLFQVDDPIRRSRGGLGLGLAIAKRCADRLGADLSLQSPLADGRGTVFQIVL